MRGILDQRDNQLDVRDGIHHIESTPARPRVTVARGPGDDECDEDNARDATKCDARDEAAGLGARGRGEPPETWKILAGCDAGEEKGVSGEGDIVEGDGRGKAMVACGVLGADDGRIVEAGVRDEVCQKA